MTASPYPPLWEIWRNPIVRRYATSRLRLLPVLAWSFVVQALAAFLWLVVYFAVKNTRGVFHADLHHAALAAWTPILILQGLIWLLKGTFSVAVGIAREGSEGLSEVQRLTPLGAWHKVVGYLCGLPILETMLVASLLPWSAVSIVFGHVPAAVVFRVHLLLVTSALLHHAIGLVAGTVIRQKIVAGTVSQVLVITLHFIVPLLARFGLGPLGHLGVEKAITEELMPLYRISTSTANVRFLDFQVSLSGYAWMVMVILILFLLQILHRRWQRADAHLFSKPLALAFSGWIILMSLGETIPLLRDGTLFDLGNRLAARAGHAEGRSVPAAMQAAVTQGVIPLAWAGAFGCIALLVAMILAVIITPTLELHVRAKRARQDDPGARLPWGSDARSALLWTGVLGLMALAGWSILVKCAVDTPLLHLFLQPGPRMPLILGAGLLIPLLTWAILLEWRGLKIACLGAFVFWIVPVMVAIVGILSGTKTLLWPKWWLAASGFALPFYSISQSLSGLADLGGNLQTLRTPWLVSLGVHAVLAVIMYRYLRRAQNLSVK